MLEPSLKELRDFVARKSSVYGISESSCSPELSWPAGGKNSIVMKQDTAVELGNPREGSVSFVLWVENADLVHDGTITVLGRDLPEQRGRSLPFGKVVIAGVHGFDKDNSYDRYREMELLRYDVDLKGYMVKGVLQNHREWSRVSRGAVDAGFSLRVLGNALIGKMKSRPYVESAEVIFAVPGREDLQELRSVLQGAIRIVAAMDRMAGGLAYFCNTCEYKDVCDEVGELKNIHSAMAEKSGEGA